MIRETITINAEVDGMKFAQIAAFLVSDSNLTGARKEYCGYQEEFACLVECTRGSGGFLSVTLECTTHFSIEKSTLMGRESELYRVPQRCINDLMQAIGLFPVKDE